MGKTLQSHLSNPKTSLEREIAALGPWFHNLHLPKGVETAPDHPLGDFPSFKWQEVGPHIPEDLAGWRVLDIGCNAGYYSFELAKRGASVTAIDVDPHYLKQAAWAAAKMELSGTIEFRRMQVYDLARTDETYDLVWFMGVFYHLRYPLLALDILSRITKRLLVFQALTIPGEETIEAPEDLTMDEREKLRLEGWPKMAFIERRLAADPTNWWVPNHPCVEAMLRSCGLTVTARPGHEIYLAEARKADGQPSLKETIDDQFCSATGWSQTDGGEGRADRASL